MEFDVRFVDDEGVWGAAKVEASSVDRAIQWAHNTIVAEGYRGIFRVEVRGPDGLRVVKRLEI